MNKAKFTAFCGMITAVSVVLMSITTLIPVFMYVIPLITGIAVLLVDYVCNKKWAAGTFVATAVLSLLLVTDKEAVLAYAFFFGYYPIIKQYLIKLPSILKIIIQFVLFNASAVLVGVTGVFVFGLSAEEYKEFGKATIPILLGLANVMFIMYDLILRKYSFIAERVSVKIKKNLRIKN